SPPDTRPIRAPAGEDSASPPRLAAGRGLGGAGDGVGVLGVCGAGRFQVAEAILGIDARLVDGLAQRGLTAVVADLEPEVAPEQRLLVLLELLPRRAAHLRGRDAARLLVRGAPRVELAGLRPLEHAEVRVHRTREDRARAQGERPRRRPE